MEREYWGFYKDFKKKRCDLSSAYTWSNFAENLTREHKLRKEATGMALYASKTALKEYSERLERLGSRIEENKS